MMHDIEKAMNLLQVFSGYDADMVDRCYTPILQHPERYMITHACTIYNTSMALIAPDHPTGFDKVACARNSQST